MSWLNIVLAAYAVLIAAGGVFGYVKAGSPISLWMSLAAAALIVVGLVIAQSHRSVGYGICASVAALLALFFGFRLIGGSVMPGLPAMLLSLMALGACVFGHFNQK